MTLPLPNLDDRRFQDLVDDAKRLVMRRCPEWTDHNVSDPGVTLIETFAFMTDQLLYRLNRVPDRLYVKFLELIGLSLLPPVPARAPVTFWTSAPVAVPLTIEAGTQIGTARTETEEPVLFCTSDRLVVVPCGLDGLLTGRSDGPLEEWFERFRQGAAFDCFGAEPRPGDVLLIGLDEAVPRCAVQIEVDCHVEGIGVDPDNPPLVWEAWTGEDWRECELSLDETGGLNRPGVVILHVPDGHEVSVLEGERAAWLRARVVEPGQGSTGYSASPSIRGLGVCTVGGTVQAVHADVVEGEVLGESEGSAGQRFTAERSPVMEPLDPPMVQVSSEDGWEDWQRVEHFAASGPDDPHYVLDAVNGVVQFGPAVRNPDGTLRHHGAVPEQGATIRIRQYLTGGGAGGNVGQGAICMLRSTLPHVTRVENRRPAQGGVDGESLDEAKLRGPITLRTRSRAVTAEDHEVITRQAAPEIARVRCLPVSTPGGSEVVKVLVVPAANQAGGRIRFEDLLPHEDTLRKIAERLDEVRMVGSRVLIEPPLYRGVTVVARVVARRGARADRVNDEALAALHAFLNPLTGGPDGRGWPFGRAVHEGEVYSVLQRVRGVEMVEQVRLFGANPLTGERGQATGRIELDPTSLVFSYEHQVRVEQN